MAKWEIGKVKIGRVSDKMLEIEVGGKKAKVFTEDLAEVVREELPADRAEELFAEMEEREILKGKARVVVKANKPIAKGEEVVFKIDVAKYLDSQGAPSGVRATPSGILF